MKIYTHRNGETEPPTVEGKYWFSGEIDDRIVVQKDIVNIIEVRIGSADLLGMWYWSHVSEDICRLSQCVGQWWGPIVPPWGTGA